MSDTSRPVYPSQTPEALRARHEAFKARGLCPTCGKNEHAFLSTLCQPCLDATRERGKRLRNHKRDASLRRFANLLRGPRKKVT